jgi:hypothetical protein
MVPSPPAIVNKDVFDVTEIIDPDTIIPRTRTFQPKIVAVKKAPAGQQWNQARDADAQIFGVDPSSFTNADAINVPVAGFAVRRGSLHRPDTNPYFVGFYMLAAYQGGTEVKIPLDFTGKTRLVCTQSLVRVSGKSVCLYCTIQDTPVVVWRVEEDAS